MSSKAGPRKAITLKDIAEDTGYSVTAISHALRGFSDISPEAKAVITESATRLGYIGNRAAASLQSGKSRIISVIVGDTSNPFFAFIAHIIENELRRRGYSSFFMNTNEDEAIERQCLLLSIQQKVDGIIWCPAQQTEDNLRFLESTHVPFVLIGRHFRSHSTNYVAIDDYKAGQLAAQHLIRKGHFRVIYIDTLRQNSSSTERYNGFISTYRACSKPFQHETVYFDTDGNYYKQLIHPDGQWRADAIIAYNDLIAWDVLTHAAFGLHGIFPPSSPSILAFDNLHSFLPLPFSLTSVAGSKFTMSKQATEVLLRQIEEPNSPHCHVTIDVDLIDRGSVSDIAAPSEPALE